MGLLAIVIATIGVTQGFRLWLLLRLGGWSRRGGAPVRRAEQPVKFWANVAGSGVVTAIYAGVACWLVWLMISALQGAR